MKELDDLLKKFSPEELAVKLGVSVSSVFKWKAGDVKKPLPIYREKILKLHEQLTKK